MMFSPYKYKNKLLMAILLITGGGLPSYAASVTTDSEINELISRAIETHPLVGSARAEQQATTEGIRAAKLNLLPTPSASTSYNSSNNIVSEIGIRQPLWTGGRLTANVNQAIFDDKAAVENIYAQQNEVAKTTIEAWQTYVNAVAQQRVYVENLQQLAKFEAMMNRRVKQGVSARIDLELVANRILQETNAFEAAQEQQYIAEARLQQITGRPLPSGSEHNIPQLSVLVDQAKRASIGFERMAFDNASFYNPSVVKELFQIESAKQEVKAQSASQYPTVFAEYTHTYDHDTKEDDGKFYVGLNYQPGAGFSNLALTRASEARVNSLIQNKEAAQRSVMENIQVQYQQFASAKSREVSLVSAVAGAQIVLDSYQRQFIAGRKSWLEVLNAVRELSDYQISLVQTRSEILGSFYKLQVDFSLMPWQTFAQNRQNVKTFRALDPVKEWVNNQQNSVNSLQFGYGQNNETNSTPNLVPDGFYIEADESLEDEYIHISLPSSIEERLDNGEFIMLDDNGRPIMNTVNTDVSETDVVVVNANPTTEENLVNNSLEPDTIQTDTVQTDTVQTDTVQIDSVQIDSVQMDSVQMDSVQMDSVQMDTVQMDNNQADTVQIYTNKNILDTTDSYLETTSSNPPEDNVNLKDFMTQIPMSHNSVNTVLVIDSEPKD